MIQGLLTRPMTDQVVEPFVRSAGGTLHKDGPDFQSVDTTKPVSMFGVLRGTGEVLKRSKEFYYFDHAYYFKEQKHGINPIFKDRIYRLTKNALSLNYIDKLDESDYNRLKKFREKITIKDWQLTGTYIVVLPPSQFMKNYYGLGDTTWEDEVKNILRRSTDREVRFRLKTSKVPFMEEIKGAWAVISFQTTAAVDAVLAGVPSFCDKISCALPVSKRDLFEIEKPLYAENRSEWIDSLLANQYTLTELRNGFAWNRLKNK